MLCKRSQASALATQSSLSLFAQSCGWRWWNLYRPIVRIRTQLLDTLPAKSLAHMQLAILAVRRPGCSRICAAEAVRSRYKMKANNRCKLCHSTAKRLCNLSNSSAWTRKPSSHVGTHLLARPFLAIAKLSKEFRNT